MYGKGSVSVCGKRYTMYLDIYFDDKYNWDKGKSVVINGKKVFDSSLGRLHEVGLAQEYKIKGSIRYIIAWKKGEPININAIISKGGQ